jgi:hypothetical protein
VAGAGFKAADANAYGLAERSNFGMHPAAASRMRVTPGVGQNGMVLECFESCSFALKTRAAVKWQRDLPECMRLA